MDVQEGPRMAATKNKKGMNNWLLIGIIIAIALTLFVVVTLAALKFFQTETYYVLNTDVPTRTQVTSEMLSPVTTSEGTAPKAAIGIGEVQSGEVYTQYPLVAGDILTASNVGSRSDISNGIPDSWVVTNLSVSADNAVGGRIQRGTYFDIMVTDANGSSYPFVNVLALDTTVDLSDASSSDAAETEEAHAGQTTQYVVGMSPQDAARLQHVIQQYGGNGGIRLVLSPRQNEYAQPQLSDYTGIFAYNRDSDAPVNEGANTDYTFTDVQRDKFGKPVEQVQNCSQGNAKLSEKDCQTANNTETQQDTTQPTDSSPTTEDSESPEATNQEG